MTDGKSNAAQVIEAEPEQILNVEAQAPSRHLEIAGVSVGLPEDRHEMLTQLHNAGYAEVDIDLGSFQLERVNVQRELAELEAKEIVFERAADRHFDPHNPDYVNEDQGARDNALSEVEEAARQYERLTAELEQSEPPTAHIENARQIIGEIPHGTVNGVDVIDYDRAQQIEAGDPAGSIEYDPATGEFTEEGPDKGPPTGGATAILVQGDQGAPADLDALDAQDWEAQKQDFRNSEHAEEFEGAEPEYDYRQLGGEEINGVWYGPEDYPRPDHHREEQPAAELTPEHRQAIKEDQEEQDHVKDRMNAERELTPEARTAGEQWAREYLALAEEGRQELKADQEHDKRTLTVSGLEAEPARAPHTIDALHSAGFERYTVELRDGTTATVDVQQEKAIKEVATKAQESGKALDFDAIKEITDRTAELKKEARQAPAPTDHDQAAKLFNSLPESGFAMKDLAAATRADAQSKGLLQDAAPHHNKQLHAVFKDDAASSILPGIRQHQERVKAAMPAAEAKTGEGPAATKPAPDRQKDQAAINKELPRPGYTERALRGAKGLPADQPTRRREIQQVKLPGFTVGVDKSRHIELDRSAIIQDDHAKGAAKYKDGAMLELHRQGVRTVAIAGEGVVNVQKEAGRALAEQGAELPKTQEVKTVGRSAGPGFGEGLSRALIEAPAATIQAIKDRVGENTEAKAEAFRAYLDKNLDDRIKAGEPAPDRAKIEAEMSRPAAGKADNRAEKGSEGGAFGKLAEKAASWLSDRITYGKKGEPGQNHADTLQPAKAEDVKPTQEQQKEIEATPNRTLGVSQAGAYGLNLADGGLTTRELKAAHDKGYTAVEFHGHGGAVTRFDVQDELAKRDDGHKALKDGAIAADSIAHHADVLREQALSKEAPADHGQAGREIFADRIKVNDDRQHPDPRKDAGPGEPGRNLELEGVPYPPDLGEQAYKEANDHGYDRVSVQDGPSLDVQRKVAEHEHLEEKQTAKTERERVEVEEKTEDRAQELRDSIGEPPKEEDHGKNAAKILEDTSYSHEHEITANGHKVELPERESQSHEPHHDHNKDDDGGPGGGPSHR